MHCAKPRIAICTAELDRSLGLQAEAVPLRFANARRVVKADRRRVMRRSALAPQAHSVAANLRRGVLRQEETDMREKQEMRTMRRREPLFYRCSFHPQRRAHYQWYEERLCEECWKRVHDIQASGF
jgi:hypothetical protein